MSAALAVVARCQLLVGAQRARRYASRSVLQACNQRPIRAAYNSGHEQHYLESARRWSSRRSWAAESLYAVDNSTPPDTRTIVRTAHRPVTPSAHRARTGLTINHIYRHDATGVVVVTAT